MTRAAIALAVFLARTRPLQLQGDLLSVPPSRVVQYALTVSTPDRRSSEGDAVDGQPDERRLAFDRPAKREAAAAGLDS
jgi:hypothetical protein